MTPMEAMYRQQIAADRERDRRETRLFVGLFVVVILVGTTCALYEPVTALVLGPKCYDVDPPVWYWYRPVFDGEQWDPPEWSIDLHAIPCREGRVMVWQGDAEEAMKVDGVRYLYGNTLDSGR